MNKADLEYYRSRKATEEAAAQQAGHPSAVRSHLRLAEQYAGLVRIGEEEHCRENVPTA